jgi:CRISPR type III-A-associated protein Csm2
MSEMKDILQVPLTEGASGAAGEPVAQSAAPVEAPAEAKSEAAPEAKPDARPEAKPRGDQGARPPREPRPPRGEGKPGGGPRPEGGKPRPQGERREGGPRPGGNGKGEGAPREGGHANREFRSGDRGPRPDRGGRPDGPLEIGLESLMTDSLYLDNAAHAVVARMRDMDSGTKSQLRRLHSAVRRACRAPEADRQHQFVMLRARLAYTIARHQLRSLDVLEKLLLAVTRRNDVRAYERFRDLFEAIVAYNE